MNFLEAEDEIVKLIKDINWNEAPKHPDIGVRIIEAKAALIHAHKKLQKVIQLQRKY